MRTFAVTGTFDDCQRMVKARFAIGRCVAARLLIGEQHQHRAAAAAVSTRAGEPRHLSCRRAAPGVLSCRADLDNAAACLLRATLGFSRPGDIVRTTNANRSWIISIGEWRPRAAVATRRRPWTSAIVRYGAAAFLGRGSRGLRHRVTAHAVEDGDPPSHPRAQPRSAACGARTAPPPPGYQRLARTRRPASTG